MKPHRSTPFLGIALAAALAAAGRSHAQASAPTTADSARMETGRTYTRWFYEGKTDTLFALFTPEMRQLVGDARSLAAFRAQVRSRQGAEVEVVGETVTEGAGLTRYARVARFAGAPVTMRVAWATDAGGRVAGFEIRPYADPAANRLLDYRTKTALRLPFDGEWHVGWGGRTREQNYHVDYPNQRFAYDLLGVRDGKTHDGDGSRVEQYHCWGRPLLAPGAGTVAAAVDGVDDQRPGTMDRAHVIGNHVILDHGNGEFSLLAHMRKGSVAVSPGDRVSAGEKLGECGNSGNTSEPHLHYQLQSTPVFGAAEGLPAQFQNYVADGRPVARGEPVRGQTIAPAPR